MVLGKQQQDEVSVDKLAKLIRDAIGCGTRMNTSRTHTPWQASAWKTGLGGRKKANSMVLRTRPDQQRRGGRPKRG